MSAAIVFTTRQHEGEARRVRESSASLPGGAYLSICTTRATHIELGLLRDGMSVYLEFFPGQARAVAAELLACADALQGRA